MHGAVDVLAQAQLDLVQNTAKVLELAGAHVRLAFFGLIRGGCFAGLYGHYVDLQDDAKFFKRALIPERYCSRNKKIQVYGLI
jgi:hypothetical protein